MAKASRSSKKGGAGAADHAIAVYGDAMQQHAVSATDNTIAMNNVGAPVQSGAGLVENIMKLSESMGGKKEEENVVTLSGGKKGGKQEALADMREKIANKLASMGTEGEQMNDLSELQNLLEKKGGKLTMKNLKHLKRKMTGGSGVLENIAVPAILLYINQRVGTKKNNGSKKLRKSARISRKLNHK